MYYLTLIIFTTIIRMVVSYGNHNNEQKIPALAPSTSGLSERQTNAWAVQLAGTLQGCEDKSEFGSMDQLYH